MVESPLSPTDKVRRAVELTHEVEGQLQCSSVQHPLLYYRHSHTFPSGQLFPCKFACYIRLRGAVSQSLALSRAILVAVTEKRCIPMAKGDLRS
jgi:hypothetical protein